MGLFIGGLLCVVDFLFGLFLGAEVRAALDILFLAVITGGLHLDGLADTADGLLSHRPREKKLEIMKDARVGAMGVLAIVFCILLKYIAIGDLSGDSRWIWLLLVPAFARSAQVLGFVFMDYARKEGGIAEGFIVRKKYLLLILCPIPAVFLIYFEMGKGLAAACFFLFLTFFLLLFFKKKIGGVTGDTQGALSEIIESSLFLIACS